jgi:V-type H+-transporting ATPase subunit C
MVGFVVVAGPGKTANELQPKPFCLKTIDPPKLKCGGFESQIMSTDSLAKLDSTVEGVLRRVERSIGEADKDETVDKDRDNDRDNPLIFAGEARTFKVKFAVKGKSWCSVTDYLANFNWDRIKFGETSVEETAQKVQKVAELIDSSFRAESQKYQEKKNAWFLVAPPESQDQYSFGTVDLVDLVVPDKVTEKDASKCSAEDDFIYSKNITTVVVIVPSKADADFIAWHDGCAEEEKVIPGSARKLQKVGTDKDGASLYRVLVLKSGQATFLKACREAGWAVSDFIYRGRTQYEQLQKDRKSFKEAFKTSHYELLNRGLLNWSDLLQSWTHLKVLRAAVEGNLRYGQIPSLAFASVPSDVATFRKELSNVLGTAKERDMQDAEVEDYFPYVSVAIQP